MPYNGAGVYSPPAADFPAVSGTLIQSTKFNNVINDLATGLTTAITKDGQTTPTTNLPMGGFKHTSVADAAARNQYGAAGQIQDNAFNWCGTAGGTADALTIAPNPVIAAYAAGQEFVFKAGASPNTGAATISVSALAAKALQIDGAALVASDIVASKWYRVTYDGTAFQLEALGSILARANVWTGINTFQDGSFKIIGSADGTKKVKFEVDGNTTGTERTITSVDYDSRMMTQTHGADIASAGTVNLDTATGDLVDVTGTTTITALTLTEGKQATVRFTGALTLTNGASLLLPGAANITTVAGDVAVFRGYAAGVVRCISYSPISGAGLGLSSLGTSLVFLSGLSASGSATIDFNSVITNTYDSYVLKLVASLPATNAQPLLLRVSTDNGTSFLSTAIYNSGRIANASGSTTPSGGGDSSATSLSLTNNLSNTAGNGVWGQINFQRQAGGAFALQWSLSYQNSGATAEQVTGGGLVGANSVNSIRLLMAVGNITSGNFRLYGIKNS